MEDINRDKVIADLLNNLRIAEGFARSLQDPQAMIQIAQVRYNVVRDLL